jgi:hypothetical protein
MRPALGLHAVEQRHALLLDLDRTIGQDFGDRRLLGPEIVADNPHVALAVRPGVIRRSRTRPARQDGFERSHTFGSVSFA